MSGILPAEHWASNAPAEDADTASTAGSDSTSIASSILQFREVHGRTYHSDSTGAQYWATNDERQSEALDILHYALTLSLEGKLYEAPLEKEKVKKALDIGCGTGIWAMDFADEFPDASVIGTDISPIQPTWVPPNLSFEINDCNKPWTFPPGSFDYIHVRWMLGSVVDWTVLFKEAYHALRPGGYLESFEPEAVMRSDDGSIKDTDAMGQWGVIFNEGGLKMGQSFDIINQDLQTKALREAGFVAIGEKNLKTPLGAWPKEKRKKEIGMAAKLVVEHDTEGHILFLATTLGWSREDVIAYIKQLHREIQSNQKRGYYHQKIVWGRKPESA